MVSPIPLLHLFGIDEQGYTPAMRVMRRLGRILLIVYPVGGVITLFVLFNMLWFAWRYDSGAWGDFWHALYPALMFYLLPLRLLSALDTSPSAALRGDFQALRRAAIAGDDELAPLANQALAPVALPLDGASANPATIGRIPRLFTVGQRAGWWVGGGLLAPVCLGMVALGALIIQTTGPFSLATAPDGSVDVYLTLESLLLPAIVSAIMLLSAGMAVVGVVLLWRAVRYRADLAVAADENGVRWQRIPWRRALMSQSWSAARAFYSITYKGGRMWSERKVYALDFGVNILAWEVIVVSNRYVDARTLTREQAVRAASARLCAAIARHTSLRERDVTALANQIVQAKGQVIDEGRTAAHAVNDDEAIAALEPPDAWPLTDTPLDPALPPLEISFGAPPTPVSRRVSQSCASRAAATHSIRYARALLPYTGPTARHCDLPGLSEPADSKRLMRTIYIMFGANFALIALLVGFAAVVRFL